MLDLQGGLNNEVVVSVELAALYSAVAIWSHTFNQEAISVIQSAEIHVTISDSICSQFFITVTYFIS